ncbi:gamma-glutamyl-gamma-aminobutyrate hydrolase family protein [Marinilabilia sp.]
MRQIALTLIIAWFALITSEAQSNVTHLGIVNPTARNIEKLIFFKENGFLNLDSLLVTGIFHVSNTNEIKQSHQYLTDHSINFVKIKTIKGELSIDSLFISNRWSQQFENIFKALDGLLFFGGDDVPPAIYGEKTFITTDIIDRTRNWELSFMFHLIGGKQNMDVEPLLEQNPEFPLMGICLGMQIMNVAAGGSLYQDIPSQIYEMDYCEDVAQMPSDRQHKNYLYGIDNTDDKTSYISFHTISIKPHSFLSQFNNLTGICVPSVHHQAVKKLGQNLNVAATSNDGKVIEALEHKRYKNVYGFQFHIDFPELYAEDAAFRISPKKDFRPSASEKDFYKSLWQDFSERIRSNQVQ